MDASGVRRSCVTLENSAARSWLVSASSCAPRTRMSSRARSIASAACFAVASRSACSVAVNACAPGRAYRPDRAERRVADGDRHGLRRTVVLRNRRADRDRLELLSIQRGVHLASDEVERIEQRLREIVEDARELFAGKELRGEVPEEPRVALSTFGAFPLLEHPRHQEAHDERDEQEHDGRNHVFDGGDPERVARRGEEEDESGERESGGQQPTPHPRRGGGEHDREEIERHGRDPAVCG